MVLQTYNKKVILPPLSAKEMQNRGLFYLFAANKSVKRLLVR
jgi:hypothetical protein